MSEISARPAPGSAEPHPHPLYGVRLARTELGVLRAQLAVLGKAFDDDSADEALIVCRMRDTADHVMLVLEDVLYRTGSPS